jgi:OOP family OmpA-OmpF porin
MNRLSRLLFFVALTISFDAFSQSKFYRGTIGFSAGVTQYNGEIQNDFFRFKTPNAFTSLNYAHYLSPWVDIRIGAAFGSWGYNSDVSNSFDADFFNANADLKLKLIHRDNPRWSPYLFGGIGVNQFSNWILLNPNKQETNIDIEGRHISADDLQAWTGIMSCGAGVQVRLAERVFLNFEERLLFPYTDASDGIQQHMGDQMLRHTIGINFGLFPWGDADADGVEDKKDKCPQSPSFAKVDQNGCPVDNDLDGVADFEDGCPQIFGMLSAHGCPDMDGDSFADDADACPSKAGIAAFGGCPDSDGDGIKDDEDMCPDLKGDKKMDGCPDKDQDGVADPNDRCPSTPLSVKVDIHGCPLDKDGDGVFDHMDKCPDVAGLADLFGCPEVKDEVKEIFRQALTGIRFETGNDIIKKESFSILDQVVKVMMDNPAYKLNISGHTDNVGDPTKNLDLSNRRAIAVKNYLTTHGVEATRIPSAIGFGDQKPIGDNSTKEGKTQNRRVEFEVIFD